MMSKTILLPAFSFTYRTDNLSMRSRSGECDLCRLLWQACQRYDASDNPTVTFNRLSSVLKISGLGTPVLSIFRDPELQIPASKDIQIGFGKLPESGSAASLEIVRAWLQECDNHSEHFDCRLASKGYYTSRESAPTMPTRVLDVGIDDNDLLRLCRPSRSVSSEWIALTHPWGTGPHYGTTRENVEAHMEGIDFNSLPATFRDAITITRALGRRYLWIDSLCIIQGPGGDLNDQIRHMEDVYSGAYCVIAASRSTGHDSGFLKPRSTRQVVALRHVDSNSTGLFYVCEMIDDFQTHVLDGSLNRRAWVMQEHALARRTIFFAEQQTYWECGQGVRCESLMSMTNNLAASLGDPNFPRILTDGLLGEKIVRYQQLYEVYSRLGLTMAYDRPIAIDSLQRRLLRVWNVQGGFGMLDDGRSGNLLCRSLLWCRGADMIGRNLEAIKFPADRSISAVPSWSWMAYTGGIDYFKLEFGKFDWALLSPPWTPGNTSINGVAIVAKAQKYKINTMRRIFKSDTIVFDKAGGTHTEEALCVVLGIEKGAIPTARKTHYFLLVSASHGPDIKGLPTYHRIGAGFSQGWTFEDGGLEIALI